MRYDISYDPVKDRWHLDASWKAPARPAPPLHDLRAAPVVAVDVNAGHLVVAVLAPDGNVTGTPFTIPLELAGLPATARDGRVRAAVSALIATAREHGARAVVIEDLNFAEARSGGREKTGNRPSRGKRGRGFRHLVAGIPTARFRDRLVQMTANAGLSVVIVDPAYTSRWAAQHWLAPLRDHHPELTGHHAAALVIGRRGQGHRAVIPGRLVFTSGKFHREAAGITPPKGVRVHVAGIDLIRDERGDFRVLGDNVRAPSGVGYVLEYPSRLLAALRAAAPPGVADPFVVVLTPACTTPPTSSTPCSPG